VLFTTSLVSRVKQLYLDGKSISEISESCNLTRKQVRYSLMKHCKYTYIPEKVDNLFVTKYPGGKITKSSLDTTEMFSKEQKIQLCKEACLYLTERHQNFRRSDLTIYLENKYGENVFSSAFVREFLKESKKEGLAVTTSSNPNGHNIVWIDNTNKSCITGSNRKAIKNSVKETSNYKQISVLWGMFKFKF